MICEGIGDKYSNYEINKNLYTPQTTKWLNLRYQIQFKTYMIRYNTNTDVIIVLFSFSLGICSTFFSVGILNFFRKYNTWFGQF